MAVVHDIDKRMICEYLGDIKDPEIPVLSIIDLGIVRDIRWSDNQLEVIITPTYSGCPAMDVITTSIRIMLSTLGFEKVKIIRVLSPAWTTDWISEEGKRKMKTYGIAPPGPLPDEESLLPFASETEVQCPRCNSRHTRKISEFGSTACKSLYTCNDCDEPFEHFRCH